MLDSFFSLFSHDIGIDLGTSNSLVWVKGKGIVIREPTIVARHKKTKKIIAMGEDAKKMLGKTPENIIIVKPVQSGVIADFDAAQALITHFIQSVHEVGSPLPFVFSRPRVVIGIPSSVSEVERRAVWEAALSAGAREAHLIEEPMAAAIGEGFSVFQPKGAMIVDIGGGTTEIAVISLGGIVVSRSLKIAGSDMNSAISHYVRLRHGLLLGEATAENIKLKIGSAYVGKHSKVKEKEEKELNGESETQKSKNSEKIAIARGRDIETGLPKSIKVTEAEVREALAPTLSRIIENVAEVLEEAPPELTSDILERGILLTGGGSKLEGIEHLIVERTRIPVVLAEDPLSTVAKGTGRVLQHPELLKRVKVIGGLN